MLFTCKCITDSFVSRSWWIVSLRSRKTWKEGNARRSRTSGEIERFYRFLQRISRMPYTSSPAFTPPIYRANLPRGFDPRTRSTVHRNRPLFSESLISVVLALFFSNQAGPARRIWSETRSPPWTRLTDAFA